MSESTTYLSHRVALLALYGTLVFLAIFHLLELDVSPSRNLHVYAIWLAIPTLMLGLYFLRYQRRVADREDLMLTAVVLMLHAVPYALWFVLGTPDPNGAGIMHVDIGPLVLLVLVVPAVLRIIFKLVVEK